MDATATSKQDPAEIAAESTPAPAAAAPASPPPAPAPAPVVLRSPRRVPPRPRQLELEPEEPEIEEEEEEGPGEIAAGDELIRHGIWSRRVAENLSELNFQVFRIDQDGSRIQTAILPTDKVANPTPWISARLGAGTYAVSATWRTGNSLKRRAGSLVGEVVIEIPQGFGPGAQGAAAAPSTPFEAVLLRALEDNRAAMDRMAQALAQGAGGRAQSLTGLLNEHRALREALGDGPSAPPARGLASELKEILEVASEVRGLAGGEPQGTLQTVAELAKPFLPFFAQLIAARMAPRAPPQAQPIHVHQGAPATVANPAPSADDEIGEPLTGELLQ